MIDYKQKELIPSTIIFTHQDKNNIINQFRPNLTPRQIFLLGSFGGTYWRPIYSNITHKNHKNRHLKFKKITNDKGDIENWWKDIPSHYLTNKWKDYDINMNKYKVKCGTTLREWENSGWITSQDPYGWVEWYCNFYSGRRSKDDERQIKRWLKLCGPNGRFKKRLINMIKSKNSSYDDYTISPVIRQTLQHWGYQLTELDLITN